MMMNIEYEINRMWRSWNGDGVGFYIFNGYGAKTEFNYFHGAVAGMNFDLHAGL